MGFVRRDVSTVYRVTRVRVANDDLRAECVREGKCRREREKGVELPGILRVF